MTSEFCREILPFVEFLHLGGDKMNYRKVKFEYFQVVFRKNDDQREERDRLFDLLVWMDKAMRKSLEGRTYDYRSEQARLENAYWDDELGFSFLHFCRLRDTNIPSKAKANDKVIPLELEDDEYIGEEVSALYDENNHVLMLQRNKYSLGPEGIEEYLNLVWGKDNETIYLRPICPPDAIELARNAAEYRKINLRFADIKGNNEPGILNRLKSPLKKIVGSFGEYEGINAQIIITVGNTKEGTLHEETVKDTLDDIQENRRLFSKAEIAKRDCGDSRVELIDLFDHKAHDITSIRMERRETLNHFTIAKEMWRFYSVAEDCNNRQKDINRYLS